MTETFQLKTEPAQRKVPVKFENKPAARQALLLVDMDDMPGQQSMFNLNGPKELEHEREIPQRPL